MNGRNFTRSNDRDENAHHDKEVRGKSQRAQPLHAQLILIRGIPGSGKSTIARTLTLTGYRHFEADMFFSQDGKYRYDPERIREAHAWCQQVTRKALEQGERVVVSNTFTQRHELEPYFQMSRSIRIVEAQGQWENIHGVPPEKVQLMRERWETVRLAIPFHA